MKYKTAFYSFYLPVALAMYMVSPRTGYYRLLRVKNSRNCQPSSLKGFGLRSLTADSGGTSICSTSGLHVLRTTGAARTDCTHSCSSLCCLELAAHVSHSLANSDVNAQNDDLIYSKIT